MTWQVCLPRQHESAHHGRVGRPTEGKVHAMVLHSDVRCSLFETDFPWEGQKRLCAWFLAPGVCSCVDESHLPDCHPKAKIPYWYALRNGMGYMVTLWELCYVLYKGACPLSEQPCCVASVLCVCAVLYDV